MVLVYIEVQRGKKSTGEISVGMNVEVSGALGGKQEFFEFYSGFNSDEADKIENELNDTSVKFYPCGD